MPLADYLNRKENMHITVSQTIPPPIPPRGTWCIGNAVSHKCVLAFITAVDKGEWMLWRDCDNSALCMNWKLFLLKHDHPSNVEWYICTSAACFSLDVLCDQYNRWFLFSSLPFLFLFSLCQQVKHNSCYLMIFLNVFTFRPVCKVDSSWLLLRSAWL